MVVELIVVVSVSVVGACGTVLSSSSSQAARLRAANANAQVLSFKLIMLLSVCCCGYEDNLFVNSVITFSANSAETKATGAPPPALTRHDETLKPRNCGADRRPVEKVAQGRPALRTAERIAREAEEGGWRDDVGHLYERWGERDTVGAWQVMGEGAHRHLQHGLFCAAIGLRVRASEVNPPLPLTRREVGCQCRLALWGNGVVEVGNLQLQLLEGRAVRQLKGAGETQKVGQGFERGGIAYVHAAI